MKFVLLDETAGATTSDGEALTPQLLALAAQAFTVFLNRDVAPFWGGQHMVRAGSSGADIQENEVPSHTQPALADAPGAIAYHTVDGAGIPDILDGITLSDTLFGPSGWSVAQTHELAETIADPGTNTLRADGQGKLYAQEVGDPIEVQSYPITILADGSVSPTPSTTPGLAADGSFTLYVTNFVLDSFFTPGHAGPYDFMTATGMQQASAGPAGPFQLVPSGGGDYQIVEPDPQQETQVTATHGGQKEEAIALPPKAGRVHVHGVTSRRLAKKRHPSSRPYRRGLRV